MKDRLFSRSALLPVVLAAAAMACAEAPEPEVPASSDTSARAEDDHADSTPVRGVAGEGPVERWRDRLPDGLLVRGGACPFECCVYGEWVSRSRIPIVPVPATGSEAAQFHLEPGSAFQADSGFVNVAEIALVAVTERVSPMSGRFLEPGDTLVLLDYVGEGFHHAWIDGEVVEISDFWSSATDRPRGEVIGEHESEWWVHAITEDGHSGWFRADAPNVEIAGADACAGPG